MKAVTITRGWLLFRYARQSAKPARNRRTDKRILSHRSAISLNSQLEFCAVGKSCLRNRVNRHEHHVLADFLLLVPLFVPITLRHSLLLFQIDFHIWQVLATSFCAVLP